MKSGKGVAFAVSAIITALVGVGGSVQAGWQHYAPSACLPVSDVQVVHVSGATIGATDAYVGRLESESTSLSPKIYCPVADSSNLFSGDTTAIDTLEVDVYIPSTTAAQAQACIDNQTSTGGSCGAASSSTASAGSWAINPSISGWAGNYNWHYVYVILPPSSGAAGSYFEGFQVYHS